MLFNEFRTSEAGQECTAHAIEGMRGMITGNLEACRPVNSHVALGMLAAAHPSPMGRNVLATLAQACFDDVELANKIWDAIESEVNRDKKNENV